MTVARSDASTPSLAYSNPSTVGTLCILMYFNSCLSDLIWMHLKVIPFTKEFRRKRPSSFFTNLPPHPTPVNQLTEFVQVFCLPFSTLLGVVSNFRAISMDTWCVLPTRTPLLHPSRSAALSFIRITTSPPWPVEKALVCYY